MVGNVVFSETALRIVFVLVFYCLLKTLEMLEIYLYTLVHSQLSKQLCDTIGLLILHVLLFLIWAFYTTFTIGLIGFRLWVLFGPDPIYRYYFGKYSPELVGLVLIPRNIGALLTYSCNRLHDLSTTILRCYRDVYVNGFFPHKTTFWNS